MPDATGERTRLVIGETLSIETGAVRSGKLFTIVVPLGSGELERFAAAGLCEAPLHEFALEGSGSYADLPGFSRVVVVARHPGVTDDEGFSAQRVLFDLFPDLPRPSGQAVFSQDVFWFENPLSDAEIERISSELLGNPLINRFWHGPRSFAVRCSPRTWTSA
jgi:phosphoribosylformylglycinamidine synthase subunit PurSL